MATDAIFTDDFQAKPYWWDAAPPEDASAEPVPDSVDVAKIGRAHV